MENKKTSVASAQDAVSPCDVCRFNRMKVEWCNEYCHGWDEVV